MKTVSKNSRRNQASLFFSPGETFSKVDEIKKESQSFFSSTCLSSFIAGLSLFFFYKARRLPLGIVKSK